MLHFLVSKKKIKMESAVHRRRFATFLVDSYRNPSSCVEAPFWCVVIRPFGRPGTPAPGWGLVGWLGGVWVRLPGSPFWAPPFQVSGSSCLMGGWLLLPGVVDVVGSVFIVGSCVGSVLISGGGCGLRRLLGL